jgi:predicted ATP-dependent endonuclease of OLD family
MIQSLHVNNFTAFTETHLHFEPGINVFLGDSDTGKSHLLKLIYAITSNFGHVDFDCKNIKERITAQLEFAIKCSFDVENVAQLKRFYATQTNVEAAFKLSKQLNMQVKFRITDRLYIDNIGQTGLSSIFVNDRLETYPDKTCDFQIRARNRISGNKKLKIINEEIMTWVGSKLPFIIWDSPEQGLGSSLIRKVASNLNLLAKKGYQIFIATHSLFLLRELVILNSGAAYFNMQQSENGAMNCKSCSLDSVEELTAVDEELEQSDRYINMLQAIPVIEHK